jgi:hypothetical protein
VSSEALAAIDAILARGGDVDDLLRAVVDALVAQGGCDWAAILFAEDRELVLGPQAGDPNPGLRAQLPVVYHGARVAELVVDGCGDRAFLDWVADRIAAHCLVGWDTAGEPWIP